MTERQNPSWGNNIKSSGQVHCVRQLGLPDEEWDSVMPRSRGIFAQERHITCVKMSPDNADEVCLLYCHPQVPDRELTNHAYVGNLCFCSTFGFTILHIRLALLRIYASSIILS